MTTERRRSERLPTDVPVTWRRVQLRSTGGDLSGRMVDVSEGGCCVQPEGDLDRIHIGTVIELDLTVADHRTTRRALVVSDPGVDGRLHLALSSSVDQIDLRQLLGV